jgi:hypothetical protein
MTALLKELKFRSKVKYFHIMDAHDTSHKAI